MSARVIDDDDVQMKETADRLGGGGVLSHHSPACRAVL
jgi:hypothetical protein